ncbi:hypothetical protein EDB84DRAFT_79804 [Lactarius hengduanensis]|nr:hypothetical protein EDB84DRAFT_79804 [Lactarius hengduanensis]
MSNASEPTTPPPENISCLCGDPIRTAEHVLHHYPRFIQPRISHVVLSTAFCPVRPLYPYAFFSDELHYSTDGANKYSSKKRALKAGIRTAALEPRCTVCQHQPKKKRLQLVAPDRAESGARPFCKKYKLFFFVVAGSMRARLARGAYVIAKHTRVKQSCRPLAQDFVTVARLQVCLNFDLGPPYERTCFTNVVGTPRLVCVSDTYPRINMDPKKIREGVYKLVPVITKIIQCQIAARSRDTLLYCTKI